VTPSLARGDQHIPGDADQAADHVDHARYAPSQT
jgi:hypothetical protein